MIKLKNNFDLNSTITCGQIFRYEKENDYFIIIIKDRVISLKEEGEFIIVESNKEDDLENIVLDYFDLRRDYTSIEKEILSKDNKIKSAIDFGRGLKMIHQDPFETLISYIISQNNRVASIANSLNLLSKTYGQRVIFKDK